MIDGYQGLKKIVQCAWCHESMRYGFLQRHYRECPDAPHLESSQKICSECQLVLDKNNFPKRSNRPPDNLESRCKSCVTKYMQAWAVNNKPRRNAEPKTLRPSRWIMKPCPHCDELFASEQLLLHKPRCPSNPNKRQLAPAHELANMEEMRQRLTSKNYRATQSRFAVIKTRYGIDQKEFQRLYAEQNGKCALCKKPISMLGDKINKPHVDHDHETKKVRGLLCHMCNVGLGNFGENVALLMAAIDYLSRATPLPVCC